METKILKTPNNPSNSGETDYNFPDYGVTVRASSKQDAEEKLKKLIPYKEKPEQEKKQIDNTNSNLSKTEININENL